MVLLFLGEPFCREREFAKTSNLDRVCLKSNERNLPIPAGVPTCGAVPRGAVKKYN